ncbi:30S ribosomal protein S13 [bacterium]|jgi:small subunit ribosomal protein S13|nr:30S ribosomal protein S13 [bacterium]NBX71914.1 30S ribosomal protein S13 [bacterium]
MAQREVRIQGVSLRLKKRVPISLTDIFGIGTTRALQICSSVNIDLNTKTVDLTDDQVKAVSAEVEKFVVEGELRNLLKLEKKKLTDRRTYRGLRHLMGLPINSRTRTNAKTCKRHRGSKRVLVDFSKDKKK